MNKAEELKSRTKQFAIRVVKMFCALPKTEEARVISKFCDLELQWQQTIELLVVGGHAPNS